MKNSVFFTVLLFSIPVRADIVGGEEVRSPADPTRKSIAALYEPSRSGQSGALCTASLIGPDTAVTAAHCVDPGGPKPVLIFGSDVRAPGSEKRRVTGVAVNPSWRSRQGTGMDQGDIAVVRFDGGIPGGYQPISMMKKEADLRKGEAVTLAGYGIADAGAHSGAGTLRKTRVRITNPRPGKSEMILDQSHGHGACHGDSGGPAYVRQGGNVVLAGVTNRSYPARAPDDCAHQVVYTKVGSYQPWIRKTQRRLRHQNGGERPFAVPGSGASAKNGAFPSAWSGTRERSQRRSGISLRHPVRSLRRKQPEKNASRRRRQHRVSHAIT